MISIVGTGLAGLTMAYALAKDDFAVTLIGLPPVSQKNDDRTTAILQPNCDYLTALGLWSDLSATATPLIMMELIDGNNQVSFDASELNLDQFGYNIDNSALKKSLIQKIGQTKNITWYKTELESAFLQPHGWRLELKNGKTHSTSLLIGADGRNSTVRNALGISYDEKPEQQAALVTMLMIEKPHHYTSVEWYRSGGPLTLVPCQGKKMAVVWCDQEEIIDQALLQDHDTIGAQLTQMTQARFGTIRVCGTCQKWPIRPLKAHELIAPHAALIGEAAHVLPPIGAQGFNTSLYDIQELVRHLVKGRDVGLAPDNATMLRRYAVAREKDIAVRYHGITRLNDLIRMTFPTSSFLRGILLRGLHNAKPLRRSIMRFALSPIKYKAHKKARNGSSS